MLRLVVAAGLFSVLPTSPGIAASALAPANGAPSKRSGLIVKAESGEQGWVGQFGYHPIRFTVTAPTPSPSDRSITVRFYTGRALQPPYKATYDMAVEQDADLPIGETAVEFDVLVPNLDRQQNAIWWEVWVDGVHDPGLSPPMAASQANRGGGLVVLRPPSDWPQGGGAPIRPGQPLLPVNLEESRAPLPAEWVRYSAKDAVVLSVAQLVSAQQESPQAMAALRRWVSAGGNLIVEHTGADFERLEDVSALLQLERNPIRPPRDRTNALSGEGLSRWRWASIQLARDESTPVEPRAGVGGAGLSSQVVRGWFAETSLGFGKVVAYRGGWLEAPAEPTPSSPAQLLLRYWQLRSWTQRHGLAPDEYNADFANWLIPGVGVAPLTAFRVLVTVFVLVVGPLSYFVLRAYGRTQLLALTAPLLSALFTVCLFAYATLADGFGTQVRVRSLSLIDQARGEAACWGRYTYYAGLAPADGLTFPGSAAIYPIQPGTGDGMLENPDVARHEVLWDGDTAHLTKGWLHSREITQYLVIIAGACDARVEITPVGAALRAENRLGADLQRLYVLDDDNTWRYATSLGDGDEIELAPIERVDVAMQVRTLLLDNEPTFPVGLEPNAGGNPFFSSANRNLGYSGVACGDSLLNELLDRLSGATSGEPLPLAPRTYVAISDQATFAPLGAEAVRENGSFHVTVGRW